MKLHLPKGRVVPFLPPSPSSEPWQRRDVGVLGAVGAAVAASVLGYPAARAGAGREELQPRGAPVLGDPEPARRRLPASFPPE